MQSELLNYINILKKEHNEYILSEQLIRCGTSIGALVREAEHAESTKAFHTQI